MFISGYLLKSASPMFELWQVFCYYLIDNAILRLLNLNFKMDTKIKKAQKSDTKREKTASELTESDFKCGKFA